jgi:hypothetical protein
VVSQSISLFLFELALLLFFFLLTLNNAQEVVTLGLGLVRHSGFTFEELAFASSFKLGCLPLLLLTLGNFLFTRLALALFEGTLGTEGVDL